MLLGTTVESMNRDVGINFPKIGVQGQLHYQGLFV